MRTAGREVATMAGSLARGRVVRYPHRVEGAGLCPPAWLVHASPHGVRPTKTDCKKSTERAVYAKEACFHRRRNTLGQKRVCFAAGATARAAAAFSGHGAAGR